MFFPFWVLPTAKDRPAPAAPLLALPTEPFRLPAGDARAFDPGLAGSDVVPATILLDALLAAGEDAPAGTRLVHLPIWDVSFKVFSVEHRAFVDAVAGQVLPFTSPASSERWLDWTYAAILVGLFVVVLRSGRWILTTTPPFSSLGVGGSFVDWMLWRAFGVPANAALEIALAGPLAWLLVGAATWTGWKLGERR